MGALTYLLTWTGYSVFALGVGTVRGCNVTWKQVAWPGKWTGCHGDKGSPDTFSSAKSKADTVFGNPNSTPAQKQQALQGVANAGANAPITPGSIISGLASKFGL